MWYALRHAGTGTGARVIGSGAFGSSRSGIYASTARTSSSIAPGEMCQLYPIDNDELERMETSLRRCQKKRACPLGGLVEHHRAP